MNKKFKSIKDSLYNVKLWWMIIIFLVMLLLSFLYVSFLRNITYQNVYDNISESSQHITKQLDYTIKAQKYFVDQMVSSISENPISSTEEIFDRFSEDLDTYGFTRLAVLDRNGNGKTNDGHIIENYNNMNEFFSQNSAYLSENKSSLLDAGQINICSKKFEFEGTEYVLLAIIDTINYAEIILNENLNEKNPTYLINNDGHVLIDSSNLITKNSINLYNYLRDYYKINDNNVLLKLDTLKTNIHELKSGTFDIELGNNTYFLHYEKINENNWYIVTLVPANTTIRELSFFLTISLSLCLFINIFVVALFVYVNITSQNQKMKLYQTAYIDPVTFLGNSTYFQENGNRYLNTITKNTNKYIIVFDINKFKALNTMYGYDFCNDILHEFGKELVSILPKDNITARIYNDVFATIFSYTHNINILVDRIFTAVSQMRIRDTDIHLNLSIGIYKIDSKDKDINKVLDKAYMAHDKIKGLYYSNYYIYDDILENKLLDEQKIEISMEGALKNNEFIVLYQPKTLTNGEIFYGAEALVRWNKDGKLIPPHDFIPLFERNKFIIKLDLYIFEQVCKDMANWIKEYGYTPTISINVSKEHFVDEHFIDKYVKITNKYHIDRSKIDLEITESATVEENIDILKIINNIKEKGFIISLDDFGTGYSSLSMLHNMPIDILKIDKIFVDKANLNTNDNLINYIMLIAKSLNITTVVEGVETAEQIDFIKRIGCDIVQGYYYSKPLSKTDFENYFNKAKKI